MPKNFVIGKKTVSKETFKKEVEKLLKKGFNYDQIAKRLNPKNPVNRSNICRIVKDINISKSTIQEAKYLRVNQEDFYQFPEIKQWVLDNKARRVDKATYRSLISRVKSICDDLQIYPTQLDIEKAQEWISTKEELDLSQLRSWKVAIRLWLKHCHRVTDNELKIAGLDAKHYALRKYAHVNLNDEQILHMNDILKPFEKSNFAFNFGVDTCSRRDEIQTMQLSFFQDLKDFYICKILTPKTAKHGQAQAIGYIRPNTFELAKEALPLKNGDMNEIQARLTQAYKEVTQEPYFIMKPFHALRHVGAQRYLRIFNYNYALVAKLGHWIGTKALEDYYGGIPLEIVQRSFKELVIRN